MVSTAPADGLLGGVGRAVVMDAMAVRQEALGEEAWRAADEIVLTNSVRGAIAVTVLDGTPVGAGHAGPTARGIHDALREAVGA